MARCRELAIAAGLGPRRARRETAGSQRGMPVWCTFRDAAREEHVAREAAPRVELPPQEPEFKNSPLKVFGEHDDRTDRADAQLHGGRQRRRRRDLRRRPSRLRAAGRRRDRLREADQHLRRRLRHRLRQHGGAPRHAAMRRSRTASARSSATSRKAISLRRRPQQRRARRARAVRRRRRWRAVRHGGLPAEGARASSAPSARATTMST